MSSTQGKRERKKTPEADSNGDIDMADASASPTLPSAKRTKVNEGVQPNTQNVRPALDRLPPEVSFQIYGHLGISTKDTALKRAIASDSMLREQARVFKVPVRHQFYTGHGDVMIVNKYDDDRLVLVDAGVFKGLLHASRRLRSDIQEWMFSDAVLSIVLEENIKYERDTKVMEICTTALETDTERPLFTPAMLSYFPTVTLHFRSDYDATRGLDLIESLISMLWYLEGKVPSMTNLVILLPDIDQPLKAKTDNVLANRLVKLAAQRMERALCHAVSKHGEGRTFKFTLVALDTPGFRQTVGPQAGSLTNLQGALWDWVAGDGTAYGEVESLVFEECLFG